MSTLGPRLASRCLSISRTAHPQRRLPVDRRALSGSAPRRGPSDAPAPAPDVTPAPDSTPAPDTTTTTNTNTTTSATDNANANTTPEATLPPVPKKLRKPKVVDGPGPTPIADRLKGEQRSELVRIIKETLGVDSPEGAFIRENISSDDLSSLLLSSHGEDRQLEKEREEEEARMRREKAAEKKERREKERKEKKKKKKLALAAEKEKEKEKKDPPSEKPKSRKKDKVKAETKSKTKRKSKETSGAPPTTTAGPSAYTLLTPLREMLKGAETGWGPDQLAPPPAPSSDPNPTTRPGTEPAPHLPRGALAYSRRIEGLLEPTDKPALEDVVPDSKHNPIATLAHGLDRVLFNPGVHWLQDPRSRVYNFPPHLEVIPQVTDFAFERLSGFIKSSQDNDLWDLMRRENRTFAGSTSSLSGMLSHIYFLISGDKDVNTDNLSRHFGKEPRNFTSGQRMPASVVLNYKDGMYAIDSGASKNKNADKNILTWMGTLLEKYLTATPEEFAPYMRFNPAPAGSENPLRDAYRYAKSERFVMRSQLDCHDPRLPGTGVFDIKTRACLPIRMDLLNFEENSGYLIRSATGKVESFEKEYYDLIRSAFLKYSFQVRIGNMDGVIVAYHNTARMFGFQYISLQEMDEALFGSGAGVGDRVFAKCVGLLEKIVEEAAACFPGESVECTFEKLDGEDMLNVWVQQAEPPQWLEEGEKGPIRQLEVRVGNFLGQEMVRGSKAVAAVDEPWTMHWSISKLTSTGEDIHAGLEGAKGRQFRYIDIPTGWDADTVGDMWAALNFGGVDKEETANVPDNFRAAGKRTLELRDIARAGGEETARRESEEEGMAKVWVGGRVEWEELQELKDLLRRKEDAISIVEDNIT